MNEQVLLGLTAPDAALVVSLTIAALVLVALVLGRPLRVRFGRLEAKVDGIDRAVNNRQEDQPTLVEQVDTLRAIAERTETKVDETSIRQAAVEGRVVAVEGRLAACERELRHLGDRTARLESRQAAN